MPRHNPNQSVSGWGCRCGKANVLTLWAARQDPPAHVGPTQYSQMVWAILFGYVLFRVGAVKIGSLTAGRATRASGIRAANFSRDSISRTLVSLPLL